MGSVARSMNGMALDAGSSARVQQRIGCAGNGCESETVACSADKRPVDRPCTFHVKHWQQLLVVGLCQNGWC